MFLSNKISKLAEFLWENKKPNKGKKNNATVSPPEKNTALKNKAIV